MYGQASGLGMTSVVWCNVVWGVCVCVCVEQNRQSNSIEFMSFWNANFKCQILIKKYQSALFKNWKRTKWWVAGKCAVHLLNRVGMLTGM